MKTTLFKAAMPLILLLATTNMRGQAIDTSPMNYRAALHWADSVMNTLSQRERIAQLFMVNASPKLTDDNKKAVRGYIEGMKLGGIFFSGGTLDEHLAMNNMVIRLAETPMMIAVDGEWGLAMRIKTLPPFPRNDILGCISDNSLIREFGIEVGRQCKAMGIDVDFAPVADVNTNPANPVIGTRSFGETTANVTAKVIEFSKGLESTGVLSVAKHFPGHGDTSTDSHKTLPVLAHGWQRLEDIELEPFKHYVESDLHGVMVGHISVPAIDSTAGLPSSLSKKVIDILRTQMGFKWLVFTDALAMKGVDGFKNVCLKALKAGNDIVLAPMPVKPQLDAVVQEAKNDPDFAREIDDKCRKVLAFKYLMRLHDKKEINPEGLYEKIAGAGFEELTQRLTKASLTVASDNYARLPVMRQGQKIAVATFDNATRTFTNEIAAIANAQCYDFTSMASFNSKIDELKTYATVIIPVSASTPEWLAKAAAQLPAASKVFVFFIPRKDVAKWKELAPASSSMVLANAGADYVQQHAARAVCGLERADGKLSMSITGVARAGAGITIEPDTKPKQADPANYGMSPQTLERIDSIATWGINEKAYSGCQIIVMRKGAPVYNKCFGTHEYGNSRLVRHDDIYDLASLTKTSATLLAVMRLYEQWKLKLDDRASDFLPWLRGTDKENITIRDLLYHESGLPPSLSFFAAAIDSATFTPPFYAYHRDAEHTRLVGRNTYVPANFSYDAAYVGPQYNADYRWQVSDGMFTNNAYRAKAFEMIAEADLKTRKYAYSCVGFIILKEIVETITGEPLNTYLEREFYAPMGLTRTFFNPVSRYPQSKIVPTDPDDFLHRGRLQGYVHDASAAFFGGVSGNAGLFSNAEDVARLYQMILNGGTIGGKIYFTPATCRLFTTAKSDISRRGLGFDRSVEGDNKKSPCSPKTPGGVYGHTGFTGTCVWVDPANELIFVFLSNRVLLRG